MKKVVDSGRRPIKLWLDDIEPQTLAQAVNLANLPFIVSHVAVMPDAHLGYGMPIGGVIATDAVVIPNAVGVDIGCGMCAVRTTLKAIATDRLQEIVKQVRTLVPVGFKHHQRRQDKSLMPPLPDGFKKKDLPVVNREYNNALTQLGTLGGGNHFIEIQQGSDGFVWLMLHSGSRNLGFKVADYYNRRALELNRRRGEVPAAARELAFLPLDSDLGRKYFAAMTFCVKFAAANRLLMMARVREAVANVIPAAGFAVPLDIAHNYAALETHFGRRVVVHRKGATRARAGETGIVPGSQGTPSYIVRGLGNPESFFSCAHGAGRRLGRKQARRRLDLETERRRLEKQGILHSLYRVGDLDEAAGAYKDIERVMENQRDLVEVETVLRPLAVIKG